MAAPATLPISNPQSESQPPIATPAFRAFLSRLNATVRHGFSQRRPWLELLDRSSFSRPDSLSEAASRIRKNFSYFRINYISLLALSLAFSLLSHPFSLIVLLSLLAAWLFLYSFRPSDQPVVVAGRTFSDREVLGILGGVYYSCGVPHQRRVTAHLRLACRPCCGLHARCFPHA
ncbi:UNVERIFIED_CONTAM: PRA1 family protein B3 [Sesamum angustifolium]|uniref:PRA1 family protein n=1 Tax=Sesamum angustifolium TaxID=2727405 RepID=A0AAW2IK41_9LAMI